MKKALFLLMSIITFLACKKSEVVDMDLKCSVSARKGDDTKVTGKWKLIKGRTVMINDRTEDYSCHEIVYNFRSDGSLIITSDQEDIIGFNKGDYKYEFSKSPLLGHDELRFTMKLNGSPLACGISNGIMTLDNSSLDGPILSLVRM